MAAGSYDIACARFRDSDKLDPAVGTRFNLADCEEKRGRVATAWSLFRGVLSELAEDDDRRPIAQERVRALEPRLPYLTMRRDPATPPGVRVRIDGVELGEGTFGVPLPMDPGAHDLALVPAEGGDGQRSTFTLRVPDAYPGADAGLRDEQVNAATTAEEDAIPDLPEDADFSNTRVLLVDDDLRNIFALRTVLEARGIEVLHAANGRLALEMLAADPDVDLVLMDTMMPELDGLSATRQIRETKRLADLPIISLTAKAMQGDREKALEAGASGYVTKPVDPGKLLSVIHLWRQRSAAGGAVG